MYLPKPRPPAFTVARWFFARALAAVFFCAFASLLVQVRGLIGKNGIAPAWAFLDAASRQLGSEAFWAVPSLCWIDSSDGTLIGLCVAGIIVSVVMAAGVSPGGCALALWALYLSLVSVSSPFLDFQWDGLLLETALLAALALPWRLRPAWETDAPLPRFGRWLLWWLLFRLMFESGLVKLMSDPNWRNFSALDHHFATQPLPLWTAWYAHFSPHWLLRAATGSMFAIELVAPFLIAAPRRWRHAGAWALIALQVGIIATGNFAFFNLLTLALCMLLFDDAAWVWPRSWRERLVPPAHWKSRPRPALVWLCGSVAAVCALLTLPPLLRIAGIIGKWSNPLASLRSFNGYGLFAVMTTQRPEIIVEGSEDGETWREYGFSWKPGDVMDRPQLVAPHQPRLDWQMWFAALGGPQRNPWFGVFLTGLLKNQPEVTGLLELNPFPSKPPRYVRAVLYEYRFARADEGGAWWFREEEKKSLYWPAVTLNPAAAK
jgi:hypothetical protein